MSTAMPAPGRSVPPRVAVLIPAHNEAKGIGATLESVLGQTRRPDLVLVVAHNCTDDTAAIARQSEGVQVEELDLDTAERKTAPLNFGMERLLAVLRPQDFILTVDADTRLRPELIQRALAHFRRSARLGAAGAHHLVGTAHGLLQLLQKMEMERSRGSADRRAGRRTCMSGMCSMYRVAALLAVRREWGRVYESWNSTEDWQLTFALKSLGWLDRRPRDLLVEYTPVTTWKALFDQRERWGRGYWQTLCHFKVRRFTLWPWALQAWWVFSTAVFFLFAVLEGEQHHLRLTRWLAVVTVVMVVTSVLTVRRAGARAMLAAALIIPEQAYIWWINSATLRGIGKQLLRKGMQWNDVRER